MLKKKIITILLSLLMTVFFISCEKRVNTLFRTDPVPDVHHLIMKKTILPYVTPLGNTVQFMFIGFRQMDKYTEAVIGWHVLVQATKRIQIVPGTFEIRSGERTIRSIPDPGNHKKIIVKENTAGNIRIRFPKVEDPSRLAPFNLVEIVPAGVKGIVFRNCRVLGGGKHE